MNRVAIRAIVEISSEKPGKIEAFKPQRYIANKKNLKLMSRSVKLGVSAIAMALDGQKWVDEISPIDRAMFTGSNPLSDNLSDIAPALETATDNAGFNLKKFALEGIPLIHPLWLVKGLSNNVLGFSSAQHDFQGANSNYCQGHDSGITALHEAVTSVLEGRAKVAIAAAADSLVEAAEIFPFPVGEGAAAILLGPEDGTEIGYFSLEPTIENSPILDESLFRAKLGYLGVANSLICLSQSLKAHQHLTLAANGLQLFVSVPRSF